MDNEEKDKFMAHGENIHSCLPKVVKTNTATQPDSLKKRTLQKRKKNKDIYADYDVAELPIMYDKIDAKTYVAKLYETNVFLKPVDLNEPASPKNKKKFLSTVFSASLILTVIVFVVYCTTKINFWSEENVDIDEQLGSISELVVETVVEPENSIIDESENDTIDRGNNNASPIDYTNIPLVDVDFSKLKEINPDTVAYIKINGLDVNAPIVQTTDNDFYLEHSFDKTPNSAGWIFGDYRNDWVDLKDNTIVYGHNRKNYAMFGSLKLVFDEKWYSNKDNHFVYISTDKSNMVFEIFSAYTIPTETYYLRNSFSSKEKYREFLNTIIDRSEVDFDATVDVDDKILTLSTCYTNTTKTVIHAKLVKRQDK